MIGLPQETSAIADPSHGPLDGPRQQRCALFVSTSLATWATHTPERLARDVQVNDTTYRRLDPEYYAWLRSRMNLARLATKAGNLGEKTFDGLRAKFNAIHTWAMERWGAAPLLDAVRALDARRYAAPAVEPEVVGHIVGAGACEREAAMDAARAMVDAIRERALALGWTERALYNMPVGRPVAIRHGAGLMYYLGPKRRVGDVTRQWIEIIGPHPAEVRTRFHNPDVEQPWIIPVGDTSKDK